MPTCYLHVGAHKTGSTALQRFLKQNRETLAKNGLHFPLAGSNPQGNHLPMLKLLFERRGPRQGNGARRIERELDRLADRDIIISSEDLQKCIRTPEFGPIARYFQNRGYAIKVLMFLRNQPHHINSQYAQQVGVFAHMPEFGRFVRRLVRNRGSITYTSYAERLHTLGVEAVFRPYSRALRQRGIEYDFLEHVLPGAAPEQFAIPPRANVSAGPVTVAAIRALVKRLDDDRLGITNQQRVACKHAFRQTRASRGWRESRSFFGLDTSSFREIEAVFKDDNDRFALRVWGRSWEEVFPEDVDASFESNEFTLGTASPTDRQLFSEIMDEMWPKIRSIAIAAEPAT